jgi:segregation and condensation protein B
MPLLEEPKLIAGPQPVALTATDAVRPIECLLFVAGEPLTPRALAKTLETDETTIHAAVQFLRDRYSATDSALQIVEIAGGYQMGTRSELGPIVGRYLAPRANRLSRPALETVTIVAYRQPLTVAEVEAIRGVASDGVLKTLIDRELVAEVGRKPTPGRPILYGTTDAFLHYFGLASLGDLPPLDEEDEEDREAATIATRAAGVETEAVAVRTTTDIADFAEETEA